MTLKEQAKLLYKTAFPNDTDDFIDDFLNRYFLDNCRYILKDGKLVSMLFLLPCELKTKEKSYSAAYLYAAATCPEYRGQGFMSQLIEKVKKETVENGKLLVTKPATEKLYGYYAKNGFKTAFYSKTYAFSNLPKGSKTLTAEEYINKREELLKEIPHISLKDMSLELLDLRLIGNTDFCAAIDVSGDAVQIKEYLDRNTDPKDAKIPFAMLITPKKITLPEKMHFGIAMD